MERDNLKLDWNLDARVWYYRDFDQLEIGRKGYDLSGMLAGVKIGDTQVSTTAPPSTRKLVVTLTESREPNAPRIFWDVAPAPTQLVEHKFYKDKVEHIYTYSDASVRDSLRFLPIEMPTVENETWSQTGWLKIQLQN